ncbi:unnamed protein product, partial [Prorocentrum cordatum]
MGQESGDAHDEDTACYIVSCRVDAAATAALAFKVDRAENESADDAAGLWRRAAADPLLQRGRAGRRKPRRRGPGRRHRGAWRLAGQGP